MKKTIKIFSWLSIVIGSLALISLVTEGSNNLSDAFGTFFGGGIFLAYGILVLSYFKSQASIEKENIK